MPKFNIGDKVINRPTSLAPVHKGRVVGMMEGQTYKDYMGVPTEVWDVKTPDWTDRFVYYVLLDTPSQRLHAEFNYVKDNDVKFNVMTYTEDDLMLFEIKEEALYD